MADNLPADNATPDTPAQTSSEDSPWGTIFWGVVLIAVGIGAYIMFGKFEAGEGPERVRIPAVILIVYKILGKTGTLAVFSGLGGLMTLSGLAKVFRGGR